MPRNRFAPPHAVVAPRRPIPEMRKPACVWLTQALALLGGGVAAYGLVVLGQNPIKVEAVGLDGVIGRYLACAGLMCWTSAVIFGTQRRRPWGRWVTLVFLGMLVAVCGFVAIAVRMMDIASDGRVDWQDGDVEAFCTGLVSMGLCLLLLGAFAFSNQSRAWWRPNPDLDAP